jgi:hypothetical protein
VPHKAGVAQDCVKDAMNTPLAAGLPPRRRPQPCGDTFVAACMRGKRQFSFSCGVDGHFRTRRLREIAVIANAPSMHAALLENYGGEFRQAIVDRPVARPGRVLVRIAASAVNPLDVEIRSGAARCTVAQR